MVPTMVAMLADAPERAHCDVSSLRTVIYGGAPMPEPVLERALAAFGPIFVQIYGLTEAPHPDLILGKDDHLPDRVTGKRIAAGATGRVATGVSVRLVGADGRDVGAGELGELVVAGPHVMAGYWNDPAATAETLRDGGCHTGDLAIADAHGVYTIVDRKKEMIISGGYNVYPREVEDALYRHPAVAECAVIGVPDPLWGEAVLALIVAKPGCAIAEDDLRGHCARELAGYKKPRRIGVVAELPKTANGKIDKKALRAAHAGAAGAGTRAAA
jgi:acyl-CoA synthetase (AMP-forming)/AMP-acid ligase II